MTVRAEAARFALGTMNFGARTKEPEARAIAERFTERSSSALPHELDTANIYAGGESERIVGRIVASAPGRFRVATKVGLDRIGGKPEGLSAASVRESLARSLDRMKLARVHTLYLHAPDRETPVEETVTALAALHREGLFEAWGVSNFASWRALELVHAAASAGLVAPARSQVVDNVLARGVEVEHLEFCRALALESVAYNPLAGGLLAGTVSRGEDPKEGRFHKNALYKGRYLRDASFESAAAHEALAAEHGLSLLALAYRFIVHHRGHGTVLLGPSRLAHVDAAFDATQEPLEPALLAAVNGLASTLLPANAPYAR
jgi:aryl-alcohol dehydrogenase-like predicted oxidoreductase